ncbi:MAG TPA: hypothetical protein VMH87_12465 [Pseudomonadales bacterium]|nr:hypothetical protein [Pseudomonadales bacterium]
MKKIRLSLVLLTATVVLIALTGCNTVSTSTTKYLGSPAVPITDADQVQVLHQWPNEAYDSLGEITAVPSNGSVKEEKIDRKLQKTGAKMGADAVVIVSDRAGMTGDRISGPFYDRNLKPDEGPVIIGVAIRFKSAPPVPPTAK